MHKKKNTPTIISDKRIEEEKIPPQNLWFIQVHKEIVGPYLFEDLKKFIHQSQEFPLSIKVSNAKDNHWDHIYNFPDFDIKPSQILLQKIYVKSRGLFYGPYSLEEFYEGLNKNIFLFSDYISFNKGASWEKVADWKDLNILYKKNKKDLPTGLPKILLPKETSRPEKEEVNDSPPEKALLENPPPPPKPKNAAKEKSLLALAQLGNIRPLEQVEETFEGLQNRILTLLIGPSKKYIITASIGIFCLVSSGIIIFHHSNIVPQDRLKQNLKKFKATKGKEEKQIEKHKKTLREKRLAQEVEEKRQLASFQQAKPEPTPSQVQEIQQAPPAEEQIDDLIMPPDEFSYDKLQKREKLLEEQLLKRYQEGGPDGERVILDEELLEEGLLLEEEVSLEEDLPLQREVLD